MNIARTTRAGDFPTAIELLELAGIIALVRRSSANGVPLGAEASGDRFKPVDRIDGHVDRIDTTGGERIRREFCNRFQERHL